MNVENVSNYKRLIFEARVVTPDENDVCRQICHFEIKGQAFLWHMIRNIVSVMFYVGKGLEQPTVVDDLFNIEAMPRKPNYEMALDNPLVLHDCEFKHVTPTHTAHNLWELTRHYELKWEEASLVMAKARDALDSISKLPVSRSDVQNLQTNVLKKWRLEGAPDSTTELADTEFVSWDSALQFLKSKGLQPKIHKEGVHKPLKDRNGGTSYEEKINNLTGKRKERFEKNAEKMKNADTENFAFYHEKQALG